MLFASWQEVAAYFSHSGIQTDGAAPSQILKIIWKKRLRRISHQQLNTNTFTLTLSRSRLGGQSDHDMPGRAMLSHVLKIECEEKFDQHYWQLLSPVLLAKSKNLYTFSFTVKIYCLLFNRFNNKVLTVNISLQV